jgi:hypothetical protein
MILFPDVETNLVSLLQSAFPTIRVATKKAPANEQPSQQIVLSVSYASENPATPVLRYAGVVLDVYGDDYATVSTTARQVVARLRNAVGANIKKVSIVSGPTRMGDDTGQEHRAISAEIVVKATDYNP